MTTPVFPFAPNWREPVVETLAWYTDVMQADTGFEQRRAMRLTPRRSFEATFSAWGERRSFLDLWLNRLAGGDSCLMPVWPEGAAVEVTSGVDVLDFDTAGRGFRDGGTAIVLGSTPWDVHASTIEDLTPSGITLTDPLPFSGSAVVYPAMLARQSQIGTISRLTSGAAEVTLQFESVEASPDGADLGDLDVYRGDPVLGRWNQREVQDIEHSWSWELIDHIVGKTFRRTLQDRALSRQSLMWTAVGPVERDAVRSFLYALKGRAGAFWLPTFNEDTALAAAAAGGSATLIVQRCGYAETNGIVSGKHNIAVRHASGSSSYHEVTNATVDAGGATETWGIYPTLPSACAAGTVCEFMDLARLDQDSLTLTHYGDVAGAMEVSASCRTYEPRQDTLLNTSFEDDSAWQGRWSRQSILVWGAAGSRVAHRGEYFAATDDDASLGWTVGNPAPVMWQDVRLSAHLWRKIDAGKLLLTNLAGRHACAPAEWVDVGWFSIQCFGANGALVHLHDGMAHKSPGFAEVGESWQDNYPDMPWWTVRLPDLLIPAGTRTLRWGTHFTTLGPEVNSFWDSFEQPMFVEVP